LPKGDPAFFVRGFSRKARDKLKADQKRRRAMESMKGWAFLAGVVMVPVGAIGAIADTVVGDVDADGKVDLKEAVHALQVTAGLKPEAVPGVPAMVE
jgi:hypothetical protein